MPTERIKSEVYAIRTLEKLPLHPSRLKLRRFSTDGAGGGSTLYASAELHGYIVTTPYDHALIRSREFQCFQCITGVERNFFSAGFQTNCERLQKYVKNAKAGKIREKSEEIARIARKSEL